ncbi:hypothetical protein ADL27_57150 [Streptomyces sp. NRRL F-6602]|nr:hypothetical protein ADL27_57150 [Streptomyces sp. NRRL F-6602]
MTNSSQSIPDRIAEEIHRRAARLEELHDAPEHVRHEVRGELIGLRAALGIALGHRVPGGDADADGYLYYQQWLDRQSEGAHQ